ncbi:GntR family transcriptional regulator [Thomasclavelia sp.]|uniref:GntR family transcriptional regulator n=1 Tax=Thomasclavelia sp. TaxID=3025757 RepID=UPI0025FC2047|nr:GntR family transcriptional regulator [Thomasclavelia sp.]
MKKIAKYMEIFNYFKDKIENGELVVNTLLPSEDEIIEQFSVSHMTISRSMNELAAHGYIKRIKGKGTYVDDGYKTKIEKDIVEFESITEMISNAGLTPSCELIKYLIIKGKDIPDVARKLEIDENDFVHFFVRARYGNDSLICLSYTYISQEILPTINIKKLEGSFNEYVDELKIERSYGYMELGAALPDKEQSKIIGSSHVPLLKQTIMWYAGVQPFELTTHYFIANKFSIRQERVATSNKLFCHER